MALYADQLHKYVTRNWCCLNVVSAQGLCVRGEAFLTSRVLTLRERTAGRLTAEFMLNAMLETDL